MNNEDLLEFYQYRLHKKLIGMQQMERAAYMMELFGQRWMEVYEHLSTHYPQLLDAPTAPGKPIDVLGDLADQFECHALSRSIDDIESAGRAMRAAKAEIERLSEALKKANEQAEHFERHWYLRGNAIKDLADTELREIACIGSDAPVEDALGRLFALVPNEPAKGPGGFSPGPA